MPTNSNQPNDQTCFRPEEYRLQSESKRFRRASQLFSAFIRQSLQRFRLCVSLVSALNSLAILEHYKIPRPFAVYRGHGIRLHNGKPRDCRTSLSLDLQFFAGEKCVVLSPRLDETTCGVLLWFQTPNLVEKLLMLFLSPKVKIEPRRALAPCQPFLCSATIAS